MKLDSRSIILRRAWVVLAIVVLLSLPLTFGRTTYRLYDFAEVHVGLGDSVTLRISARGAYQQLDSAGRIWTIRGSPYYFHARLEGPTRALADYSGIELTLRGRSGYPVVLRSSGKFIHQVDDSSALGIVVGTVALPFEPHAIEGRMFFETPGKEPERFFADVLTTAYKEEKRWIFLEVLLGV